MVWFCWHFEFVVDDIVVSLFINSIRRQGSNNCADSVRREALSSLMANILHDSIVQIPWMCVRLCTWESKRSHMVRAMAITIARTRGRQKIKKSRRRILKTWSRWSTLDQLIPKTVKTLTSPYVKDCFVPTAAVVASETSDTWSESIKTADHILCSNLILSYYHIFATVEKFSDTSSWATVQSHSLWLFIQNIYLPTVPWAHHRLLIGTIVKILNIFLFSREVLGDTVDLRPK